MEWAKQSLKTEPQGISTPNQDERKAARKLKTNGQNSRTTKLRQEEEKRKWWKMIMKKENWKYPSELGNVKAISELSGVVVAEASMKWVKKTSQSINGGICFCQWGRPDNVKIFLIKIT